MIDLSLFDIETPKATDNSCGTREGGVTFIYHKNGKRIMFSKRILEMLGNPQRVKFGFVKEYLIIIPSDSEGFLLKKMNKQNVIYNADLIKEVLEYYDIIHNQCFCKTFSNVEEINGDEKAIAIKMQL